MAIRQHSYLKQSSTQHILHKDLSGHIFPMGDDGLHHAEAHNDNESNFNFPVLPSEILSFCDFDAFCGLCCVLSYVQEQWTEQPLYDYRMLQI
jgi:hypothetical protein